MTDNLSKCEICLKTDQYQMCPDCFNNLRDITITLKKQIKQDSSDLKDSLKDLMNKNKNKALKVSQHFSSILLLERINKNIQSLQQNNNSQKNKIERIKQEIANKRKRIAQICLKHKELKANQQNHHQIIANNSSFYTTLNNTIHQSKIANLKALFKVFLIDSKAYIPIKEYFEENEQYWNSIDKHNNNSYEHDEILLNDNSRKYEEVIKICSETVNGNFLIEDQMITTEELCPFKLSMIVLKNKIKSNKLNRFIVAMQTFVYYSALKLKICLPHSMDPFCIQSNKNDKPLSTFLNSTAAKSSNIKDVLNLINLLNQNLIALMDNVFDLSILNKKQMLSKPVKNNHLCYLLNLGELTPKENDYEQLRRNNSDILQIKNEIEVDGFVVINEYFK